MTRTSISVRRSGPIKSRRSSGFESGPVAHVLAAGGPALFVLLAILVGGGSAPGLLSSAAVELASVLCLLYIALRPGELRPLKMAPGLSWLALALAALVLFHLLPLPPQVWASLPGRGPIAEGYRMLGEPLPWLPISLDPARGRASALGLLPGICAMLLVLRAPASANFPLAATIVAAAVPSIILGIAQVTGGPQSPLYLYRITNTDNAVGFFANANHLATLLLIGIPLAAACALHLGAQRPDLRRAYLWIGAAAAAALLVLGLFIVGSVAGVLLAGPVLLASAGLLRSDRPRRSWVVVGLAVAGLLALAGATASFSSRAPTLTTTLGTGQFERLGIAKVGWKMVQEYSAVGAGIGAFPAAYKTHEALDGVTKRYVNHAHNDYLEVLIETGIAGTLLLGLFIFWWGRRSLAAWSGAAEDAYWKRAASIGIGVVIIHSIVDYPARTGAIVAIVGALCAILGKREVRVKHVVA